MRRTISGRRIHQSGMKNNKEKVKGQKLLTNRQFCEQLGMSYEWGRKKVQRRQIAFVQIGRSVRIPETELDRFIEANLVPARDEAR
jgi:excisionase family DNA binding protein